MNDLRSCIVSTLVCAAVAVFALACVTLMSWWLGVVPVD